MKTIFTLKKLGIALTALAITTNIFSQENAARKSVKLNGGFGHGSFTIQQININGLNNLLTAQGYGKINPYQMSWGGGGNFAIKNFLIGGEGAGFVGSRVSNNSNSIDFTGGYGHFNFGYIIYSGKRSVLYPMLGIGGGGFSILVNQKNQNNNFEDQINSPAGGVIMDAGGLLLNAQIAYQYFICGHEKEGFFIGLKTGYRYSPGQWKMSVNGNELNNAPRINMNGFYATIILGGGSLTDH